MSHLAVLVEEIGRLFTAGPPVMLGGTGEDLAKEQLGGAGVHRRNGTIERFADSEYAAFALAKRFLSYLPGSVYELPPVLASGDPADRREEALAVIDPRDSRPLLCAWVRDAYRVLPELTGRPSFGTRP
jgi:acetyl-CoA carboxylase carboxyltransferase component